MRTDFTLYVYKTDRRYKSGERAVRTQVVPNITEKLMAKTVAILVAEQYPAALGYRVEYHPSKIVVNNLMTGKPVEIDRDTPWCCNPASESYWSM